METLFHEKLFIEKYDNFLTFFMFELCLNSKNGCLKISVNCNSFQKYMCNIVINEN